MKKFGLIAILAVIVISSCKDDSPLVSESFIERFLVPQSLEMKWFDVEHDGDRFQYFLFEFDGEYYNKYNPDPDLFRSLIDKYGDNKYYRHNVVPTRVALGEVINTISITATTDWDERHPEGSSLNDYFWLSCSSAWPYVNANYRNYLEWTRIAFPLNFLGKEPLKLVAEDSMVLFFLNDPPTGELGLKVVLHGEKDYEWEGTIDFG